MGAKHHHIIIHILTSPEHCLNEFIATACTSIMRSQLPNAPNMQCPLIELLPMSEATHYNTTPCIIFFMISCPCCSPRAHIGQHSSTTRYQHTINARQNKQRPFKSNNLPESKQGHKISKPLYTCAFGYTT